MDNLRWGVIGFGEAGAAFAQHISTVLGAPVLITDPLLNHVPPPHHILHRLASVNSEIIPNIALLTSSSQVVLSLVTPGVAHEVAVEAARAWSGDLYVDLNSVSPAEKRRMAELFPEGCYVDAAVLGSISGTGAKTRVSLAGPSSDKANTQMRALGLNTFVIGPEVGAASALKMSRSIFMKGIECLLVETLLAAEQFDIAEDVLASVEETINSYGVRPMIKMLVTTHAVHCGRRAEEMYHVAETLKSLSLPHMLTDVSSEFLCASNNTGITKYFNNTVPEDPGEVIRYLIGSYREKK